MSDEQAFRIDKMREEIKALRAELATTKNRLSDYLDMELEAKLAKRYLEILRSQSFARKGRGGNSPVQNHHDNQRP